MKLGIVTTTLILISQTSFGQFSQKANTLLNKSNLKNQQIITDQYISTNQLPFKDNKNIISCSEEEWEVIKNEIKTNRNKIKYSKEKIYTRRVLDTIYLEI